jgi:hypothetical protein
VAGAALSNNVWLSLSFDSDPYRGNNVWLINGPNIICNPDHVQIHGKKIIKKKLNNIWWNEKDVISLTRTLKQKDYVRFRNTNTLEQSR